MSITSQEFGNTSMFEKVILYFSFIFTFVFLILIIYTVLSEKKWNPETKAFFFLFEILSYVFIMLSIIYYISSYFKQISNTNIIKDQLFSMQENQNVLSNIFFSEK